MENKHEKVFVLKKDISHPSGIAKAGTESIYEQGYYWFPFEGKEGSKWMLGNAFGFSAPDELWPGWFEEKSEINQPKGEKQ